MIPPEQNRAIKKVLLFLSTASSGQLLCLALRHSRPRCDTRKPSLALRGRRKSTMPTRFQRWHEGDSTGSGCPADISLSLATASWAVSDAIKTEITHPVKTNPTFHAQSATGHSSLPLLKDARTSQQLPYSRKSKKIRPCVHSPWSQATRHPWEGNK